MSRRLEESRARFEERLLEVREALGSELGVLGGGLTGRGGRRGYGWVVPAVGVGVGLLLAWRLFGGRRRRATDDPGR